MKIFLRLALVVAGLALATSGCNGDEPMYLKRSLSSWAYDLDAKEDFKRKAACEAIAALGPAAAPAIPKVAKLLDDPNPGIAAFAGTALAKIGPAAVPALEGALKNPQPVLRLEAAASLLEVAPDHAAAQKALVNAATGLGNADLAKLGQQRLLRLGATGASLVAPYLEDQYRPVRLAMAKYVGKFEAKGAPAKAGLLKLMHGKDSELRIEALKSFSRIATKEEAAPELEKLTEDKDEEVAANAGVMLQYIGSRTSASGNETEDDKKSAKK